MRQLLKVCFGVALGVAAVLAAFELLLRLLPIQNGIFASDPDPKWPVHHLIPFTHYTFSDAWDIENVHRGATNNMGYVAPFNYAAGREVIAVVGDSFVEGLMNNYADMLQSQIAQRLSGSSVYAFGTAGASLPDYLGLGRFVRRQFPLRWVVIVIVAGDFTDAFAPEPGFFVWDAAQTPPARFIPQSSASPLRKLVRSMAVVRYIRGNLRFSMTSFLHSSVKGAPEECRPQVLSDGDKRLISQYASALPMSYGVPPSRIILLFDPDRPELYRSDGAHTAPPCPTRDALARAFLAAQAQQDGQQVLDLGPVFSEYFVTYHRRVDYSPVDWHWNAIGHALAAQEVARVIQRSSTPGPQSGIKTNTGD